MKKNKEIKQCPYCGEDILAVAKKCKHCGEWLIKEEPAPIKIVSCPTCGEDVEEGKDVCPHCGEPMYPSVDSSSIVSQPSNAGIQQPVVQPLVTENKTSQQIAKDESSSTTLFKDFFTGMGLSKGLFILLIARFIILLLNLTESSTVEVIATILDVIIGSMMSLLIIQRVASDRSKIDVTSFLAIGSCVFWPIGMYIGTEALNNISLEALEYARMDDSGEGATSMRYFFASGMVWFCLSLLLDVVSKFFMWQTAKPKFKSTLMLGIVAYSLMLLVVLSSKSFSEIMLIAGIMIPSLMILVFYSLILTIGIDEQSESQADDNANVISNAEDSKSTQTESTETNVPVITESIGNESDKQSTHKYLFGGIVLVLIISIFGGIYAINNKVAERLAQPEVGLLEETTSNTMSSDNDNDYYPESDSEEPSSAEDILNTFVAYFEVMIPYKMGDHMTCTACKYNSSENSLTFTVLVDNMDMFYESKSNALYIKDLLLDGVVTGMVEKSSFIRIEFTNNENYNTIEETFTL